MLRRGWPLLERRHRLLFHRRVLSLARGGSRQRLGLRLRLSRRLCRGAHQRALDGGASGGGATHHLTVQGPSAHEAPLLAGAARACGRVLGVRPVGVTERHSGHARGRMAPVAGDTQHCSLCFFMHSLWKALWQHLVLKMETRLPSRRLFIGDRQIAHAFGVPGPLLIETVGDCAGVQRCDGG